MKLQIPKALFALILLMCFISIPSAWAYIGPGAGFAFLGSAFAFILVFFLAILTILLWPLKFIYQLFFGKRISKRALTKRLVVLGLDGLDPGLTERYLQEGRMPHLKALAKQGCFHKLTTTFPSISPVAWSTFQTGVNPGAHNIYDFLTRDKRLYVPDLSSTQINPPKKRFQLGPWSIPLDKPDIRLLRKSQPFWKILGKNGVFSHILRVPISCTPEKFEGNILAGMCTPDLRGSQGTFTFYTTKSEKDSLEKLFDEENISHQEGGVCVRVQRKKNKVSAEIVGPVNPLSREGRMLTVPFQVKLFDREKRAELKIQKKKVVLELNQFSEWVELQFKPGLGNKIFGIVRFCLREIGEHFSLYVSPINIDPENPALPISHPPYYSAYLAKKQGKFGTLGLMEDTWALNEAALDEERFLDQAYLTHGERKLMFFDALEKTKKGLCVCVFDASDRIQHMFWRYLMTDHPAPKREIERFKNVIPDMYSEMDRLVGQTVAKLRKGDMIIVLSDHGFTSFKRCLNLNTWLMQEGYLKLEAGKKLGSDYLQDVDWSQTKAFAIGLSGIFINRVGREKKGIVQDSELQGLKAEISEKLLGLKDPANQSTAILNVYDTAKIYHGAYVSEAPDLIVGYKPGYRVSWESVTGKIMPEVFSDNLKAWSGDHCVDATCVPGVFFSNRKIKHENPDMLDMAPTILNLFGIYPPKYMEGKPLYA